MTEKYTTQDGDVTIHHKSEFGKRGKENIALARKKLRSIVPKLEAYRVRNKLSLEELSALLGFGRSSYGQWVREYRTPWVSTVLKLKCKLKDLLDMERQLDSEAPKPPVDHCGGPRASGEKAETEALLRPILNEIEEIRKTLGVRVKDLAASIGISEFTWYTWRTKTPLRKRLASLQNALSYLQGKCSPKTLDLVWGRLQAEQNVVSPEVQEKLEESRGEFGLVTDAIQRIHQMEGPPARPVVPDNYPLKEQRVHYTQLVCKECGCDIKIGNKIKSTDECPLCGSTNIKVKLERVMVQTEWLDREQEE